MIPQEQLKYLTPLPDMVKRARMVHGHRTVSYKKGRLTKRARQWAAFVEKVGISNKYPQGTKSYGLLPMNERTRKVVKK
jgi:hypothetical protein